MNSNESQSNSLDIAYPISEFARSMDEVAPYFFLLQTYLLRCTAKDFQDSAPPHAFPSFPNDPPLILPNIEQKYTFIGSHNSLSVGIFPIFDDKRYSKMLQKEKFSSYKMHLSYIYLQKYVVFLFKSFPSIPLNSLSIRGFTRIALQIHNNYKFLFFTRSTSQAMSLRNFQAHWPF